MFCFFIGTFFGMKPCGIILFVYELFISESKSQVYGILHDVFSKWGMDKIGRKSYYKSFLIGRLVEIKLAFILCWLFHDK